MSTPAENVFTVPGYNNKPCPALTAVFDQVIKYDSARSWLMDILDAIILDQPFQIDSLLWASFKVTSPKTLEPMTQGFLGIPEYLQELFISEFVSPVLGEGELDLITQKIITSPNHTYIDCIDTPSAYRESANYKNFERRYKIKDSVVHYRRILGSDGISDIRHGVSCFSNKADTYNEQDRPWLSRVVNEIVSVLTGHFGVSFDDLQSYGKNIRVKDLPPTEIITKPDPIDIRRLEAVHQQIEAILITIDTSNPEVREQVFSIKQYLSTVLHPDLYGAEPQPVEVKFDRGKDDPLEFAETHYGQHIKFFGGDGNLYQSQLKDFDQPLKEALASRVNYLHKTGQEYKGQKLPPFSEFIPPIKVKGNRIVESLDNDETHFIETVHPLLKERQNPRNKRKRNAEQ